MIALPRNLHIDFHVYVRSWSQSDITAVFVPRVLIQDVGVRHPFVIHKKTSFSCFQVLFHKAV